MNILEVTPRNDGKLSILTEDGRRGVIDLRPYFQYPAFHPLRNPEEFVRVRNGRYFVEWPCGADLSADTIEAHWTFIPGEAAQQPYPEERCR